MTGFEPLSRSFWQIAATIGDLPVPPVLMFPTDMTCPEGDKSGECRVYTSDALAVQMDEKSDEELSWGQAWNLPKCPYGVPGDRLPGGGRPVGEDSAGYLFV